MNKTKAAIKNVADNIFSIMFLLSVIFFAFMRTIDRNPDTDSYFLIENGRYIFEYKVVPTTNPWSIVSGLGIIIQQPLCSLLNYLGYCAFGLKNLWILAAIENMFLLFAVYQLCSLYTKETSRKLLATGLFELILTSNNYITTRPYQITMCLSIIEIICLYKYFYISQKHKKDTIKLFVQCCLLTLLQVNYQASFTIMMFIWILCFVVFDVRKFKSFRNPLYKKEIKTKLKLGVMLYACMGLASLMNPNGINGPLYLFKSTSAISLLQNSIAETKSPALTSATGFLILTIVICLIVLYKIDKIDTYLLYMSLGTSVMAATALRNLWTMYIPLIILYVILMGKASKYYNKKCQERLQELQKKNENDLDQIMSECHKQSITGQKKENNGYGKILIIFFFIGLYSWLLIGKSTNDSKVYKEYAFEDAVAYLDTLNKDDITLYTTFNTGAYMEFSGYQIFLDARPELYSDVITKGPNLLQDWYEANTYKTDIYEFINKYGFTHFVVGKNDVFDVYLKYHSGYQKICENESFVLYERNE